MGPIFSFNDKSQITPEFYKSTKSNKFASLENTLGNKK